MSRVGMVGSAGLRLEYSESGVEKCRSFVLPHGALPCTARGSRHPFGPPLRRAWPRPRTTETPLSFEISPLDPEAAMHQDGC